MATRVDAWKTARSLLTDKNDDWGDYKVDASDTMLLACFIAGMTGTP